MKLTKLVIASMIAALAAPAMTGCSDSEEATAEQAAKDLAYLRAQKEKEVAEKEAMIKRDEENMRKAREYQKAHPW